MSVDGRLRQARSDDGPEWDGDLDRAYERVRRGARRQRTRRAVLAGGVAAAVVAAGGVVISRGVGDDPAPAPAPVAPAPTGTATTQASPVDGEWTSPRLTRGDVTTRLENAGVLSPVAAQYVRGLPIGRFRIRMLIHQGLVQVSIGGHPDHFQVVMSVSGDQLTLSPMTGPGAWVFGWHLDRGRLSLALVSAAVPRYDGFPPRVDALATFCSAPFRQG